MNPSVTPTKHEVEGWLPMPQDVAGIVYAYLGNPFVTTWEVGKSGIIRLPITELIMAGGAIESLCATDSVGRFYTWRILMLRKKIQRFVGSRTAWYLKASVLADR